MWLVMLPVMIAVPPLLLMVVVLMVSLAWLTPPRLRHILLVAQASVIAWLEPTKEPEEEDFVIDIMIDQGPQARSVRLNLPKFTLIAATTRPKRSERVSPSAKSSGLAV